LSAFRPIVGNPKRDCREFGALKNALPLVKPKSIVETHLYNGFEPFLGELASCVTEVCVLFTEIEGLNIYGEVNHDDILLTPSGKRALTTLMNERCTYKDEEWEDVKERYLFPNGVVKPGTKVRKDKTLVTRYKEIDYFKENYVVFDEAEPEDWSVGKVLIGCLKSMVKQINTNLVGVNNKGNRFQIDAVISGVTVKDKKVTDLLVSAVLARENYGYLADFNAPLEDLSKLAIQHLEAQGESPDGKIKVYAQEEMKYLGTSVVGFLRAARLQENERTASRVKSRASIPLLVPTRFQAKQPVKPSGSEKSIQWLISNVKLLKELESNGQDPETYVCQD